MTKKLCTGSPCRDNWAVALCYASATIMSLEALHPTYCAAFDMGSNECFALSALVATLSAFMGTLILMRSINRNAE